MDEASLVRFALIFTLAGVVKGVTGMGLPTVAMGLLGMTLSPAAAAGMLVVPSFVTNVWQLVAGPAVVPLLRRLGGMMLGIVLGTVLGARLLVSVEPAWSSLALGIALSVHAVQALCSPALSVPERSEAWLSPVMGLVTGVISGATGVFVIPAVPYLQALGLEKEELVQALGLSFTVSTVALASGLLAHGVFRLEQLGLSSLSLVPALAGMWLGQRVRERISPSAFRRCFLLFLLSMGLALSAKPFS
ncbi:sulfite exporter TauE/SafE family protein [Myxococcus sp. K15C18031901]|uniref:sulfite exporter TauE/SafE family protein n=1 Tax=Myxococcus dinghuensis TaxID=2906761 RepID=UPI0020A73E1E|nr:sulfite exporter TauE/SafE family protein [Myxococcus dinghuensis]MCP3100534.1 sulfite exporter TauE/SafE family protein [Myxococcus dinghuensis]